MQDMINKLKSLRNCVRSEMPKAISESMLKETKQNFQKEAYLGNGKFEKWKERMYDVHNTPIGIKLPYPKQCPIHGRIKNQRSVRTIAE